MTALNDELRLLAERVEAATGPDHLFDAEIAKAIGWLEVLAFGFSWQGPHGQRHNDCPRYTASLDAAMSLVPEGFHITHSGEGRFMTRGRFCATVETWAVEKAKDGSDIHTTQKRRHGVAGSFPLALTAAALRARASIEHMKEK